MLQANCLRQNTNTAQGKICTRRGLTKLLLLILADALHLAKALKALQKMHCTALRCLVSDIDTTDFVTPITMLGNGHNIGLICVCVIIARSTK